MKIPKIYCNECYEQKQCCHCKSELNKEEMEYREDPYAYEVHRNSTLHRLCYSCYRNSAEDI